jgi:parallel beta-helix repeat protein
MNTQLRRLKSGKVIFIGLLSLVLGSASASWAQLVVTTLADSGPGSLRQAILDANASAAADVITFVPGLAGLIVLQTPLPTLNGAGDTIDGTGAAVVLDGSTASGVAVQVQQSNVTVRGLTIQNFSDSGIAVGATGSATVTGVIIDGNTLINNLRAIFVTGTGPGNSTLTVTNNQGIDNVRNGIVIFGSSGNTSDTLTVLIDSNTVKASHDSLTEDELAGGSGIGIIAGVGSASNKKIIATISNNTLADNESDGILVAGCGSLGGASGRNNSVDVTVVNNTVKRNGDTGILITGAGSNGPTCQGNSVLFEISGNTVFDSGNVNIDVSGGAGAGHEVQGIISNNDVKDDDNNPFPLGDGLLVSGGGGTGNLVHDITISNNVVTGNDRGILINGGTNSLNAVLDGIDVIANTVKNNGSQGILVSGGTNSQSAIISDVLIDGNLSTGNGSRGIQATRGSTVSSSPPVITLAGIANNATSTNALEGILISSNVLGLDSTPVSGNQADRNGTNGISLNSTGYVLSNNTASRNAAAGIIAVGNTDGGGNTATRNASCNTPGCF